MTKVLIFSLILVLGLLVLWFASVGVFNTPQGAVLAFTSPAYRVPEEAIADPLMVTGKRAVPAVIAAVRDRTMPRRAYAIGYLGWAADQRALPVLEEILADSTERPDMRAVALEAIACIRIAAGDSLAALIGQDTTALGQAASRVFDGPECMFEGRSIWDAMSHTHN